MEHVTLLTSRNNPLLKKIRILASGSRGREGEPVIAEGTRVLEEVVRSACTIEAVVLSETFGSDRREAALFESWRSRKIRMHCVKESLFRTLSCFRTSQGAIALVQVPETRLPGKVERNALILYACGIQDPGNLGTLIRTAAASGATLVCTSPGTVSARNPKVIRSSAGVFFHLTPVEHVSPDVFIRFCLEGSVSIYRTDILQGAAYTEADLASACAVLLGNEGSGMHEEAFSGFPGIRIPMAHRIESLNVASAGAVMLFEAARQRELKNR